MFLNFCDFFSCQSKFVFFLYFLIYVISIFIYFVCVLSEILNLVKVPVRDASEYIALCLLRTRGCAATLLHRHWTCVETHILSINLAASPGPPLHLDRCCCSREEPQLLGLAQLYLHSKITFVTFIHTFIHTFLYSQVQI